MTAQPPHADLIERNMALAANLMAAQLENPNALAEIPNGATLILIPDDDPELARFNRDLGLQALEEGEDVYFRHVSRARREAPAPSATP
jgi:hypothetical protein